MSNGTPDAPSESGTSASERGTSASERGTSASERGTFDPMASTRESELLDARATTSWAIGSVISVGGHVGPTKRIKPGVAAFDLVNRETGRAHALFVPTFTFGVEVPVLNYIMWSKLGGKFGLGSASGGLPTYTMFETRKAVSFRDFIGLKARITSANLAIGVVYGYNITFLTLWDGIPYLSRELAYVTMGGWGPMIPAGSVAHGWPTVISFGSGSPVDPSLPGVQLILVPEPDDYVPEPALSYIRMAAQEHRKIELPSALLFDFDSSELKPQAQTALLYIADLLNNRARVPVSIEGHTDSVGSQEYNIALSRSRAGAVKDWLVRHSVLGARDFRVVPLGETQPVVPNQLPDGSDNPEARQKNRRVVIDAVWMPEAD
jgi:outer membrane protein OmpA-like peptidoglycan-associated protein